MNKPQRQNHWHRRLSTLLLAGCTCFGGVAQATPDGAAAERMSRYNVIWESPSKDATGVMPIGNGDIGAGVYAIENGDLYLLLSKNDAFNYLGDIFKTGRVKISLTPNPFEKGKPFRQTLDLVTGSILIEADGVKLRIWADALHPVFHVQIAAPHPVAVTAQPDLWKRIDRTSYNEVKGYTVTSGGQHGSAPPQDVRLDRNGKCLWYFPVGDRSVYPDDLKFYEVEQMASKFPDPYRFNTFGNLLESPQLSLAFGKLSGKGQSFDIRIHALTMQTPEPSKWIAAIEALAARPVDLNKDWKNHCGWWTDFWNRSWIVASDNTVSPESSEKFKGEPSASGTREEADGAALVSQNFNVFRFLMACQSRGLIQTKFNGGIFTQQLRMGGDTGREGAVKQADGMWLTHEDDRLWGRRFTFQNQRLLYWPLLASGDFDLMKPFFDYYFNLLDMRKAITRAWFGHEGAYYRENIEPTGSEWDCAAWGRGERPAKTKPGEKYDGNYHDYYFTSGLESTAMMIDYVNFTGDTAFRDRVLVPYARETLLFFDRHYQRVDGKLRLDPAQVVETWWIAVNSASDVAGLRFCLDGLLAMKAGTAADQARWSKFRSEIPEIHLQEIEGRQAIAPAEKWEKKANEENGEIYPVFPFRCFGIGLGSGAIVDWTMKHRTTKDAFGSACWTQDQIGWACAGNAEEASAGLVRRFRVASSMCRFPMFGREGPDSCPDFDHFGSGSIALERMLVQEAGDKVILLPAWPKDWDVDFKLHLARMTVVTGTVRDGKLVKWDIQPASRKKDVTVCALQGAGRTIPENAHPLRVGMDQDGASGFAGQIGRVSMFRSALPPQAILELARGDRTTQLKGNEVVASLVAPKNGETLPTVAEDFSGAVSFEAWICPGENEGGRILDKITAGTADGVLFDAWPGLGLRLGVGAQGMLRTSVLKPGVWQHVAVVINGEKQSIYLDGKRL
jgi:hypothetical protein